MLRTFLLTVLLASPAAFAQTEGPMNSAASPSEDGAQVHLLR